MNVDDTLQEFRKAAADALASNKALFECWRELPVAEVAPSCGQADVQMLREMMKRRIYPANAFELLARIDVEAALESLLDRYLGEAVDPDSKFGGYSFELDTMLDDLVEIAGPAALRRLIQRDGFGRKHLNDPRVIEAFSNALDIDAEQLKMWFNSNVAEKLSARAS